MLIWFVHGFVLYTIIIYPWPGRIFLRLHPVLCFRRVYLRFIIRLSFLSRKAYERYILAFKDFIRPCLLASRGSFWMNVQKMKDSHTTMYILENTSYIYIFENPNLCKHSSTGMAHAQELVPLGNKKHTNSSMNSTKVKTLMYFLGDY